MQLSGPCGGSRVSCSSLTAPESVLTSQIFVLEPKYHACRLAGNTISPLGTILVADITGEGGMVAVVEAAIRIAAEPWCPVVLLTRSSRVDRRSQAVIDQFNMAPAIITMTGSANILDPGPILLAARRRPCPMPERLARYVTQRAGRQDLTDALRECFRRGRDDHGDGLGPSRSTLSRRLLDFAPLKAHDWSLMARTLAVLLEHDRQLRPSSRVHDIDPRTVRSRIKLYTGFHFGEVREQPGWEWVIEAALRRWDYVPVAPTTAPTRHQRVGGEV